MNRLGTVITSDAAGMVGVAYADSGLGDRPLPRPFVGSSTTGLHALPPVGAQILALGESAVVRRPVAHVSAADNLGPLGVLAHGETIIYGARGDILSYATATGPTILYKNAAGTLSVQVDAATNRINLNASGGVWCNGVQISVP